MRVLLNEIISRTIQFFLWRRKFFDEMRISRNLYIIFYNEGTNCHFNCIIQLLYRIPEINEICKYFHNNIESLPIDTFGKIFLILSVAAAQKLSLRIVGIVSIVCMLCLNKWNNKCFNAFYWKELFQLFVCMNCYMLFLSLIHIWRCRRRRECRSRWSPYH